MFIILISGSRDFRDVQLMRRVLIPYVQKYGASNIRLIHGNQRGADQIAAFVAKQLKIRDIQAYPAKWDIHGFDAGPIRNQEMLDKEDVNVLLAFPLLQSSGTCDMIRRTKGKNISVCIFGEQGCDDERKDV